MKFWKVGILGLAASALLATSAWAAPPSQAELQKMFEQMREWWETNSEAGLEQPELMEGLQKLAGELLGDIDFSEMSLADIESMQMILGYAVEQKKGAGERLTVLAESETAEGAAAAIVRISMSMDPETGPSPEAVKAALGHPALGEAMADGSGTAIFSMLGYLDDEELAEMSDQILALGRYITPDVPPQTLARMTDYPILLTKLGDSVTDEQRNEARTKMIAALEAAAEKADDENLADYLGRSVQFLNGAFARGELIDHPAPALTFNWAKGGVTPTTLADLKGKVVILDFWATWCGPCIASFPDVRELQEHYKGYEVAIVGVTSLQGNHFPGGGGPPIVTEGDPDKEYELMGEFMADKDMTWSVAFSEQEVFNPDFGVRGIPHVAIVDPKGVVRYNGIHPASPMAEKVEKINALLEKAGLPAPAPAAPKEAEAEASS